MASNYTSSKISSQPLLNSDTQVVQLQLLATRAEPPETPYLSLTLSISLNHVDLARSPRLLTTLSQDLEALKASWADRSKDALPSFLTALDALLSLPE